MSTDQTTLADALDSGSAETVAEDTQKKTARHAAATPLWSGTTKNQCRACGNDLTLRQARVVGDNDGCVSQCGECSEWNTTARAAQMSHTREGGQYRS